MARVSGEDVCVLTTRSAHLLGKEKEMKARGELEFGIECNIEYRMGKTSANEEAE